MRKVHLLVGSALAALVMGCVNNPCPPMDRRVTLAEDLGQDLYVTDVRCTKGSGSFLTLQANVVNNTHSDLGVAWRVQWLDADGIEISSVLSSTWSELVIQPNEIRGLTSTAPTRSAADMRLYVRSR